MVGQEDHGALQQCVNGIGEPTSTESMKRRIAEVVRRTKLYRAYHRALGKFDYQSIEFFIHEYSRRHANVYFIQVGANDGITWDPFHFFVERDGWKGIVIEPQRRVFEDRLRATYEGRPGIRLLNVAVDAVDGARPLYMYSFSASRWATGLASFDKSALVANFDSAYIRDHIRNENLSVSENPDEYITSEVVQCVSFNTLLAMVDRSVDFLITDVEGHDIQILETFPLDRVRPPNIIFEQPARLDSRFTDFVSKLKFYSYDVFLTGNDAIAVRRPGLEG